VRPMPALSEVEGLRSMVKVVVCPFMVSRRRCPEPVEGRSPGSLLA